MEMAASGLPATADASPPELERFRMLSAELISRGRTVREISKALHPQNPKQRKAISRYLNNLVRHDLDFQDYIAASVRGQMIAALPRVTEGLIRRAEKGNPQAVKLVFEACGFYNPRIKHEHTGDIKLKLEMPRPPRTEPPRTEEVIQDAEVVED